VGTPAGTYVITYTICENANPTNCDTADVTIIVEDPNNPATIDAVNDTTNPINGVLGANNVVNVLDNDSLNGTTPVNIADVILTVVTPSQNPGVTLDTTDGTVDVAPGTAPGVYTITYQICETVNPTNCDTANVIVVVEDPTDTNVIVANDDDMSATPVNSTIGNPAVVNALTNNDTLNGVVFTDATAVTITVLTPATDPGVSLDTTSGNVAVAPGTPAGTYVITYMICEIASPTNCDVANITIVVEPALIDAVNDPIGPISSDITSPVVVNILNNDTLNGAPVDPSDITLTVGSNPGGFPVDLTTGNVTVPVGTPAGTYVITYTICENANPTNCDTADVTIIVEDPNNPATIDAVNDTTNPINGVLGANNVVNVLDNDSLNGTTPVNIADVILTVVTPSQNPGVTLDTTDGTVDVAPGTAPGVYTITYQICETVNPTNCDTANVIVVVEDPTDTNVIVANDDDMSATPVNSTIGNPAVVNAITNNDTLNGVVFTDATAVTITVLTPATDPGVSLDTTSGNVAVAPNTPAGTYVITYMICEIASPTNCDVANITIVVEEIVNPTFMLVDDLAETDMNQEVIIDIYNNDIGIPTCATLVIITQPLHGTLDFYDNGTPTNLLDDVITYIPDTNYYGTDYFEYQVIDCNGNSSNIARVTIQIGTVGPACEIKIFNAISPNYDGINDILIIQGLECHPENSVEIYNRWGVLVYETQNYATKNNYFSGISEGRSTVSQGEELPDGTYFYIIKYVDTQDSNTNKQKTGYLYLNR